MDIFTEYTSGNIPIRYTQNNITEDIYDNNLNASILATIIASKYIINNLLTTFVINTDVLNTADMFMGIVHTSNMSKVVYIFKNNTSDISINAKCVSGIWTPFDKLLPLKQFTHKYHIKVEITFTNKITNDIIAYFVYIPNSQPDYVVELSDTHKLVCGYLRVL